MGNKLNEDSSQEQYDKFHRKDISITKHESGMLKLNHSKPGGNDLIYEAVAWYAKIK